MQGPGCRRLPLPWQPGYGETYEVALPKLKPTPRNTSPLAPAVPRGWCSSSSVPSYGGPVRLDHVSYAVKHSELTDTVQRLGAELGAAFQDGGRHPQFGTCNFILPLRHGVYLEIVAPLEHPATEQAPFGRAVRQSAENGGGWLAWVVAVDQMSAVEQRLGRQAVPGHRRRPDGFDLRWQQIGVTDAMQDPQFPFFVQWESPAAEHPSANPSNVRISSIELAGDVEAIRAYLGDPAEHPLEDIDVNFVDADEPGIKSVSFQTPNGVVVLD